MKEKLESSPEVDLNPHSDLPAAVDISTEISGAPEAAQTPRPLPFGVYTGSGEPEPESASENRKR